MRLRRRSEEAARTAGGRIVDEKATKVARNRQKAGEQQLQRLFGVPVELVRLRRVGIPVRASLSGFVVDGPPARMKPTSPRRRTRAEKARHCARKRQHAARRRNW